jgi:hypothetical protein
MLGKVFELHTTKIDVSFFWHVTLPQCLMAASHAKRKEFSATPLIKPQKFDENPLLS